MYHFITVALQDFNKRITNHWSIFFLSYFQNFISIISYFFYPNKEVLSLQLFAVHPLFEYDLNGKNYDQNMTIFYPKLRLKYD